MSSELARERQAAAADMTHTAAPLPAPGAAASAEEEREPGALAPRQHPGNSISGASEVFPESSVDFGFGNSWTHLPVPLAACGAGDAGGGVHPHHSPPRQEGRALHQAEDDGGRNAGAAVALAAGLHFRDDMVISECDAGSTTAAITAAGIDTKAAGGDLGNAARGGGAAVLPAEGAGGSSRPSAAASTSPLGGQRVGDLSRSDAQGVSGRAGVFDPPHDVVAAEEGARHLSPREQVSLPDDIYGAARVSEYWHGVPGLSSLVSTYVYDDIWAGDGGLNQRFV